MAAARGVFNRTRLKVASFFIYTDNWPSGLLIDVIWWQSPYSHSPVENFLLHRK